MMKVPEECPSGCRWSGIELAAEKGGAVGRGRGGGLSSMMITPLKGLRSVPNVLCSCALNDSLVSFVIIVLTNEFYTNNALSSLFKMAEKPPFPSLVHNLSIDTT